MLNSSDKSVQKINAEYNKFNPDNESVFFNKKDLGDGIVVYQVEDSKEGQAAVRKAIDSDWGYDKNPWCLAARKEGSLDKAWKLWNNYKAIPKRIAFKNGKLHAFSATSDPHTCQWWDKADKDSESIPQTTASDDSQFLKQFCPLTYAKNNPNSPLALDIFKKLSEDEDRFVRAQVAKNPKCPLDILKKLSEDEDRRVRVQVAENPSCPLDVLKKLSEDEDRFVRAQVARNPKCPLDILKKLSEDNEQYVREAVAENPSCPLDILKKLSEDENSFVIQGVAINPKCPLDMLKKLSEDGDYNVRGQIARNPKCPLDILKKLSEDNEQYVREAVAGNPNCPLDILKKLSEDDQWEVRWSVAGNPNCPLDILEKLANPETEKSEDVCSYAKEKLQSLKKLKKQKQNTR